MLVIDGHNLIPKIPGHSLAEIDDEARLIELLQRYALASRKPVEVFFDNAPPGHARSQRFGTVRAHFVPAGRKADEAIRLFLVELKKGARGVTVVTSDREVRANAHALGAVTMTSESFARELEELRAIQEAEQAAKAAQANLAKLTAPPSEKEPSRNLDQWYDLFGIDPDEAEKSIITPRKKPARPGKPAANPAAGAPPASTRGPQPQKPPARRPADGARSTPLDPADHQGAPPQPTADPSQEDRPRRRHHGFPPKNH